MMSNMPTTLKRLIASSVLYMVIAFIGAAIAIIENRPAEPCGWTTGLPVVEDFLYGGGTALSPPLYLLIVQAVFTALAPRFDRWGAVGVAGLAVSGLLFGSGELIEPIVIEIFAPMTIDLFRAMIVGGIIVVPLVMMVFGILEWARRRKSAGGGLP